MDAITFIGAIKKAKMFGYVTHFIGIYCVSITNFNRICFISTVALFLKKFSLSIGSIISTAAFCTILLDS